MNSKKSLFVIICVVLVSLIMSSMVVNAAYPTYVSVIRTKANPSKISKSGYTKITSSFKLIGGAREKFHSGNWAIAYVSNKTSYSVKYTIEILDDRRFYFDKRLYGPKTYTRTAKIFQRANGLFGVEITLEDGKKVIPNSNLEAQELMFNFSKTNRISARALGSGKNRVYTRIKANWSGYLFSGSETVEDKKLPRVTVTVLK